MPKNNPILLDFLAKAILIVLGLLWWVCIISLITAKNSPETTLEPYRASLVVINGNTLAGITSPAYVKPIVYASLIDCLELEESSCNPLAIGKAGEIGCLQFMPSTWELYCIKKYKIAKAREDIWDCELQKKCADLMIEDGLLHHWSTDYLCK